MPSFFDAVSNRLFNAEGNDAARTAVQNNLTEATRRNSVGNRVYNGGTNNPGNTAADFQTLEHRQASVPNSILPLNNRQTALDAGQVSNPSQQVVNGAVSSASTAANTPLSPGLTSQELEFNPQYADLIRTLRTNLMQVIADREAAVQRNNQDLQIGGEDINRSRDRANRANVADLANRGVLDSTAGDRRLSELQGDYDRALRDLSIGGIRRSEDINSGSTNAFNQGLASLNEAQLAQARDNLLARLATQENNSRAVAQQDLAARLSQLLQNRGA